MPIQVFGVPAAVIMLNRAFNDTSPGNLIYANQVAAATANLNGFANDFAASFASLTNAQLAQRVLDNLGLLPNDALRTALTDYYAANGAANRGLVTLQLANILTSLEGNATYGAAAASWNDEVATGFTYSANPANTGSQTGTPSQTFTLTAGQDTRTGGASSDTFDGATNITAAVTATLQGFDAINGGGGRDTLILNQGALLDAIFNGVTSIERVVTTGNVTLGAIAQRAGVDEIVTNGGTLTLSSGYTTDTLSFTGSATAADQVSLENAAAGTNYRVTLTGADVGNGSAVTGGGALAVTLQKEDGSDSVVGGVSRYEDEGLVFRSTTDATARFDVREASGTGNGTFVIAALGTAGADTITNAAGAGIFDLNSGNNALYLNGGAGNDTITAGNGNDFLVAGAGDDTVTTGDGVNTVSGGDGNDIITGGGGNDIVDGGSGNDSITAAAGNDSVNAGAGDDVVVLGTNLTVDDTIVGGDGRDTLAVSDTATDTATIAARATGFEVLRADATATLRADRVAGIQELVSNVAASVTFSNVGSTQTLRMTDVADNALTATLAVNTTADAGTLALGATTATGTDGTAATTVTLADYETLTVTSSGGTAAAVNSIATLTASSLTTLTATGNRQLTLTAVTGSGNLRTVDASAMTSHFIMGAALVSANAHTLTGGTGNDTLRGGANNDVITGGAGQDSILGGNGNDSISAGAGNDTLDGEAGNDTVDGGEGNDSVVGGAGNDVITGGDGNDTINGADGNDNISGGSGDDTILIAAWADVTSADTINGGDGNDTISTADGTVTLNSTATGGISNIEAVALTHNNAQTVTISDIGTGAFNNAVTIISQRTTAGATSIDASGVLSSTTRVVFTGNDLVDNYTVGNGIDSASLSGGNDGVTVGALTSLQASDTLSGGVGSDTVTFTDATGGTLGTQLGALSGFETLTVNVAAGAYVFNLTEAIVAANRDTATGNFTVSRTAGNAGTLRVNGADIAASTNLVLSGGSGADTLTGGSGNDTITGGAGADSLTGGAGNDRFVVAGGDLAVGETHSGGDGTDTVSLTGTNSTAGVTISGIEVFEFDGAAVLNATAGVFSGQTLSISAANASANANLVLDATGTQTVNLAGLNVAPTGLTAFTGFTTTNFGATADVFIGSAGRDSVEGGTGDDILQGGAGGDTLTGGAGADNVTAGEGTDTVVIGSGQDTVSLIETTAVVDNVQFSTAFATGASNASTITGFANGAGVDTFDIGFNVSNGTTNATSALAAIAPVTVASDGTATANDVIFLLSGAGDQMAAGSTLANAVANAVAALTSGTDFSSANITTGDSLVLVLDDGTNSFVFHYVADGTAATTASTDLELIGILNGIADAGTFTTGDFI